MAADVPLVGSWNTRREMTFEIEIVGPGGRSPPGLAAALRVACLRVVGLDRLRGKAADFKKFRDSRRSMDHVT